MEKTEDLPCLDMLASAHARNLQVNIVRLELIALIDAMFVRRIRLSQGVSPERSLFISLREL